MKIAVIGGGIAGTSAAWAARRAGADVTAVFDRAGASALYAGALDLQSWEEDALDAPLDSDLLAFCTALEAWSVGTRSARVATYEGVLRPARARDSSAWAAARWRWASRVPPSKSTQSSWSPTTQE